jgi:hypothetical protein
MKTKTSEEIRRGAGVRTIEYIPRSWFCTNFIAQLLALHKQVTESEGHTKPTLDFYLVLWLIITGGSTRKYTIIRISRISNHKLLNHKIKIALPLSQAMTSCHSTVCTYLHTALISRTSRDSLVGKGWTKE